MAVRETRRTASKDETPFDQTVRPGRGVGPVMNCRRVVSCQALHHIFDYDGKIWPEMGAADRYNAPSQAGDGRWFDSSVAPSSGILTY